MDTALAKKVAQYQASSKTAELIKQTQVLLLVGPTGAGKDSLKDKLLVTGDFHHIISHTTRPPRINHGVIEQDGREYHFIDKETAMRMLDEQAFIEAKFYSGNLYGTSIAEIEAAKNDDKIAMTDIEVQGVAEYKALDPHVMAVFLLPPDFKTWLKRLQNRYGDVMDVADFRIRLETALAEIEQLLNTNYYVAVINDDLNSTYDTVQKIVKTFHEQNYDDSAAREVAKQLGHDIQGHLDETD